MRYKRIKAQHAFAAISWIAGMLYMPQLSIHRCGREIGAKQSATFKIMQHWLVKAIINPAAVVTWLIGLYFAWSGHWFTVGWLDGKLLLVAISVSLRIALLSYKMYQSS
ncbi:CopD family protein [Bradyrhizobium sp. LVM 105]|uniref:CopD family protein n=1 Tax=Bradyrhizobium sp. LVM 105 TaxID=2341115 RepID=UPI000F808D88|nr:CopD family protein [Bradyrhizobium sp. LVM 105]RTE91338.1 TIGR00701 family protein [Bradyrhizobium sp. LVM 105]